MDKGAYNIKLEEAFMSQIVLEDTYDWRGRWCRRILKVNWGFTKPLDKMSYSSVNLPQWQYLT